eukprot:gene17927-23549_t
MTGAPVLDCKKALLSQEVNGDINKAIDWLRAKGLSKATDKANSRQASEGLIALLYNNNKLTLLEINSETDFVARNNDFQTFVVNIINAAHHLPVNGDINIDSLLSTKVLISGVKLDTTKDLLVEVVTRIRENIVIRRAVNIPVTDDIAIGYYVHGKISGDHIPSNIHMGNSAGVIALHSINDKPDLILEVAKKLAMHVVAAKPQYLNINDIPNELIDKETVIFREQSKDATANKKPELIEQIIKSKVNKRLNEITLYEQNHFIEEGSPVIRKYLDGLSKINNTNINIKYFHLWTLGQLVK